jgi:hypothetical protein
VNAGTLLLSGGNDRLLNTGSITVAGGTLDLGGNTQNTSGLVTLQSGVGMGRSSRARRPSRRKAVW